MFVNGRSAKARRGIWGHRLLVGAAFLSALALLGSSLGAQASNVELVGRIGGERHGIAVEGHCAYADAGPFLEVLDISDPAAPKRVGQLRLPDMAEGVEVSGGMVYVADGDSGLLVIDVGNPASPVLTGSLDTPGHAVNVVIVGQMAHVADGNSGLQIIDVSDPAAPVLRGSLEWFGQGTDIAVSGDLAYVADHFNGLRIIDVTNPASPELRGYYSTPGGCQAVAVSGGLAYVPSVRVVQSDPPLIFAQLEVVDVANPASPALRGSSLDFDSSATAVSLSGSLAYVTDQYGLQIIDVKDPAHPSLSGSFDTHGPAQDVVVSGGLAYVAASTGVWIIDVSDPSAPALRGAYQTPGDVRAVAVSGGLAPVADTQYGFQVIDVIHPSTPLPRGFYSNPYWRPEHPASGVAVSGEVAYLANGVIEIVDVSNPAAPAWLSFFYTTRGPARSVAIAGDLLFVATGTAGQGAGLVILDVSDPVAPVLRGHCETPWNAVAVEVSGNLAYVIDSYRGLYIIDVSDPAAPTLRGYLDTLGFAAEDVAIVGDLAFVVDLNEGLEVIDVSDPAAPHTIESFGPADEYPLSVAASGNLAYVACNAGLLVIDVSDPAAPALVGSYDTPDRIWDIVTSGNLAYAAGGEDGLMIFRYSGNDIPGRNGVLLYGSGD